MFEKKGREDRAGSRHSRILNVGRTEEMQMSRVLPILFNSDMVRSILDERKTVTRRVVKKSQCTFFTKKAPADLQKKDLYYPYNIMPNAELIANAYRSPYKKGDILYVRETFRPLSKHPAAGFDYAANWSTKYFENSREPNACNNGKWIPSIHMPKKAARIWLKVTDVMVEKLQSMNTGDFMAEGVVIRPEAYNDPENAYQQAKMEFIHIWDSTIKKQDLEMYGWDANPWVWAIEFERCEKPDEDNK